MGGSRVATHQEAPAEARAKWGLSLQSLECGHGFENGVYLQFIAILRQEMVINQ